MVRLWLQRLVLTTFLCLVTVSVMAASYEVTNVVVSIQAEDAVKARDLAIIRAERQALAVLIGKTPEQIASTSDAQIARLVRGFSVQGERLAARSYAAKFTIRFNPNATQMFIQSNGYDLVEQARQNQPVVAMGTTTTVMQSTTTVVGSAPVAESAKTTQNVIVLPVLDIGTRRTLWDEPNPWREIWQKNDYSSHGLSVRVPLGDISDMTDVPDAKFLSGGPSEIANMLVRYGAGMLYVVVAKSQPDGLLLSLYRHDGNKLQFIRKAVVQTRAGYAFNDGVPKAIEMIATAQSNPAPPATGVADQTDTAIADAAQIAANVPIMVTIPYQSLGQWVATQRRLHMVQGIRTIMPLRVSPSSAQVRIIPAISSIDDLKKNLAMQNFDLVSMPGGEMSLIDQ